jgi:TonB family protein
MKTIYTFLSATLILVAAHYASAQTKTVDYYNKKGVKLSSAEGAYYFEHTEANNTGGGTRTRFLKQDSTKVSLFTYSSFKGDSAKAILDGTYSLWHNNGKLSEKGNYASNELHGKLSIWFENGQLSYEKFYVKGKLQDTLKGYYEDGAVRRVEVYKDGEMVEGKVLSREGTVLPYFPAMVLPEFPGGQQTMMAYISQNVKYPEKAIRNEISGLVVISFIVDKDGSINTLEVTRSVHDMLDKEAIRIIKSMPLWKPGLLENNTVPVRFNLPVHFALQD